MRKGYDTVERAAGEQLLETLAQGVSRTGAVLAHAPTILTPLHNAAKDQDWLVRQAAVRTLDKLSMTQHIDGYY